MNRSPTNQNILSRRTEQPIPRFAEPTTSIRKSKRHSLLDKVIASLLTHESAGTTSPYYHHIRLVTTGATLRERLARPDLLLPKLTLKVNPPPICVKTRDPSAVFCSGRNERTDRWVDVVADVDSWADRASASVGEVSDDEKDDSELVISGLTIVDR